VSASQGYLDPVEHDLIERTRARILGGSAESRVLVARWTFALVFLVTAAVLAVALPSNRALDVAVLVIEIAAYAIASRVQFEVGTGVAVPTEFVFASMLFVVPVGLIPAAVAAGMALSALPELVRREQPVSSLGASVGSAWFTIGPVLVLAALGEPSASADAWPLLLALVAVQSLSDFASTAIRERWALGIAPRDLVGAMSLTARVDCALAPVGYLAAMSGSRLSLLAPLPLIWLFGRFAADRRGAIDGALELGRAYRGTAYLLGDVVEADDAYTGAHSRDVVELSLDVADRLGITGRQRQDVELVALLHDVGKIRIPNEIIRKPGPLDPDERALIETHTIEGEKLLLTVGGLLAEVGHIVRSCHERWDGGGYPDGLAGEQIPLVARIICCCDAFSAMTTDRSYRRARTVEDAADEVARCAGTHFDPAVAAALLAALGMPARVPPAREPALVG
jgi:HD-GYP domain-containing protein (c-di-GMP phosphodiesterase class II)